MSSSVFIKFYNFNMKLAIDKMEMSEALKKKNKMIYK
jgi:hypothetical protein